MTQHFALAGRRVWVAGHNGMVGQALMRRLGSEDCILLACERGDADLRRQAQVEAWVSKNQPDVVFVAAAKVGGILANDQQPAEFLYDNLMIEANIVEAAYRVGVKKLIFLGSSCIYPKFAPQPIPETALMTGPLEPTNEWYAIAKIAGIKLCQAYRKQYGCDFISAQPTNLYGPGDNYDLATSHVLPALLRKAHDAKRKGAPTFEIWGSGTPLREFLYVDDLADALVFLAKTYSEAQIVNVGSGEEVQIRELAQMVCDAVGYTGQIVLDTTKPDGTPRKRLDCTLLGNLGWMNKTPLREGLALTFEAFLKTSYASQPIPHSV
ncbi:MAG TPA: GDP-fucose synthetase [Alphaproteobacteria bacterium]|nr:GDP-fucose synthetase [Alphaproteobacteria bacterium]